jgi:hypothetical protein
MDLDHVRGRKEFKVSDAVQLAYGVSLERVWAEWRNATSFAPTATASGLKMVRGSRRNGP